MTVALFKSILHTDEGETVWGRLKQKIVDVADVPDHLVKGWLEDASPALEAHDLATMEAENAKLAAQIDQEKVNFAAQIAEEQVKLDGRTKAARDLKAKQNPEPVAPVVTEPVAPVVADAAPSSTEPVTAAEAPVAPVS